MIPPTSTPVGWPLAGAIAPAKKPSQDDIESMSAGMVVQHAD
jgi:hypothetical protein